MSLPFTIFLDAGPLSLITTPKKTPDTLAIAQWVVTMLAVGRRFVVPAIDDYDVLRELIRAGKSRSLAHLDAFHAASPDRFLSMTDSALLLAAQLWAQSRNAGAPIADPKELNADVMIAAQAIGTGIPRDNFVIATTNLGHLARFIPANLWTQITP
jgi:predicted nucleic acid-binding protein